MGRKVKTNKICVEFRHDHIERDFSFFRFQTSDKFISGGAAFLDLSGTGVVRSLVYEWGNSFYVMTRKGAVSTRDLVRIINGYENGESLSINEVKPQELPENLLVQLFLNAVANPEDEALSFNNLSGKLLCYRPNWIDRDQQGVIWGLQCLEIRIDKDMCLRMNAHKLTSLRNKSKMKFGKRKIYDYPQYDFAYNNHALKRVGKDKIGDVNNFIQKPIEGEKGSITFLDFKDYDAFAGTKNGVLKAVLNLMKSLYVEYLAISFS